MNEWMGALVSYCLSLVKPPFIPYDVVVCPLKGRLLSCTMPLMKSMEELPLGISNGLGF